MMEDPSSTTLQIKLSISFQLVSFHYLLFLGIHFLQLLQWGASYSLLALQGGVCWVPRDSADPKDLYRVALESILPILLRDFLKLTEYICY